jgi:hypothetical protein
MSLRLFGRFDKARKQTLRNLTIDENQPGAILHDFNVMLDIFRGQDQTLTDAHQIPLSLLGHINQQLKHPIQLALKRPQQKSYPHIHGLYLLLRASGLTTVDTSGRKPVLIIDEDMHQQWTGLNPTEQYGYLLETWFLRGYAQIIGENYGGWWDTPRNLDDILRMMSHYDFKKGVRVADDKRVEEMLNFIPGRHNLGLLDLFGLMAIESGPPQPRWKIKHMRLTPAGDAILSLLYKTLFETFRLLEPDDTFQEIFQPYWPSWKNNLVWPEATFTPGVYTFKVSLGPIWRRLAIDATDSLDLLASAILISVDFDDDHLYEFSYRNRIGMTETVQHPYMETPLSTSETRIGDLPIAVGESMTFVFDFGDNWRFDVLLENIDPERKLEHVEYLEEHGKAPAQYPNWDEEE